MQTLKSLYKICTNIGYSWPLNDTGLNAVGPVIPRSFSINIVLYFPFLQIFKLAKRGEKFVFD